MLYRKDKNGNELSILGFGCMRFTKKGGKIDIDKAEKEVLAAFDAGVNYYDTAYVYGDSEATMGEIFERNQMRDKIRIATKLPQYLCRSYRNVVTYFAHGARYGLTLRSCCPAWSGGSFLRCLSGFLRCCSGFLWRSCRFLRFRCRIIMIIFHIFM